MSEPRIMTKADVDAFVKECVGAQLAEFRTEMEALGKNAGMAQMGEMLKGALDPKHMLKGQPEEKGRVAAQIIRSIAASKSNIGGAHAYASKTWGKDSAPAQAIEKALAASEGVDGGFLLTEEHSADLIELLRPASVVRRLQPVMAPLRGTLTMSKITGGATGGYIGENQNIPMSQQQFGQVRATAKKLAVLVPVSNDLIRRNTRSTDAMIRDDVVSGLASLSDIKFIRSNGANGEPKGLYHWAPAANRFNANATVNLANVTFDLGAAVLKLLENNSRMIRPGWIIAPRTFVYLITVRDGNGNFAFRDEMMGGTLFGYPFGMTSQVPVNLGGGSDASEIYLADFADVILAEEEQLLISASEQAAYHDGSNVQAAFSLDQTVIRAIQEHDLIVRHAESIAVIEAVKWAPTGS